MTKPRPFLQTPLAALLVLQGFAGLMWANPGDPSGAVPDYNKEIRPILADHCFACHGVDEKARKAKLLDGKISTKRAPSKKELAEHLFHLAAYAQQQGWSAETLLREEVKRKEKTLRKLELKTASAKAK